MERISFLHSGALKWDQRAMCGLLTVHVTDLIFLGISGVFVRVRFHY
jgi:hypothetical protein